MLIKLNINRYIEKISTEVLLILEENNGNIY